MQNKTASQIQAEIALMRLAYAQRQNLNQPRRERMVGWSLVSVAIGLPAIAALIYLIL